MRNLFPLMATSAALLCLFLPGQGLSQNPGLRKIHAARFDSSFTPREALLPMIYDAVSSADLGFLAWDWGIDSSQVFMNHWFHTDLFCRVVHAAGFELHPTGLDSQDWIRVTELYFASEGEALDALRQMDTRGLRHVAFLPPAYWFWVYFRGRIIFITCIGMNPFEGEYKLVLDIVLKELHKVRVEGNQFPPPQGRR